LAVEIERKFLVHDISVVAGLAGTEMKQGYLSVDPERTVRVRLSGTRAFLTVKGKPTGSGASRDEYEYEISARDAQEMLDRIAIRPAVEKTRYRVTAGRLVWEIDVFGGENEGLVVAEVELPSEGMAVILPNWIGEEVTGDPRYYNNNLVAHPYKTWDRG
jgi:adenylate cyclase